MAKLYSQTTTQVLQSFKEIGATMTRHNFIFNYQWRTSNYSETGKQAAIKEFNALIRAGHISQVNRGIYIILNIPNDYKI